MMVLLIMRMMFRLMTLVLRGSRVVVVCVGIGPMGVILILFRVLVVL